MPKICGYIDSRHDQPTVQRQLDSMIAALTLDSPGRIITRCFANGGIALLETACAAATALEDQAESFVAVCGEIIEPPPDRTLSAALSEDAAAWLAALNGVFALAHYDEPTGALTVANDRYGFMPLYSYHDQQRFVFASEVKAILQVVGKQPFDWDAWADFFYVGHMLGQKTLFRTIQALDAAQILTYRGGALQTQTYADFTRTPVRDQADVSTGTVAALFQQAVRRRADPAATNTVLLSGGLDSRLVLGSLHALDVRPKIVTLEHASEKQGSDGEYALQMAQALGLPADYRKTRQDFFASTDWLTAFYRLDGMVPNLGLFITELYPELDRSLGRVWDGLALDVALGGSHQSAGGLRQSLSEFLAQRRTNRRLLRLIFRPQYFARLDQNFMRRLSDELNAIPESENRFLYFLLKHRTRRRIAVNPYQLIAAKVEPITPAADKDFMEYILSIPSSLKLNHRLYLELLKTHFPRLTTVPIISGGALLSHSGQPAARKFARPRQQIKKILKRGLSTGKLIAGLLWRRSRSPQISPPAKYAAMNLIIAVVEQKHFDRPFYNQRLLRRLFGQYRQGRVGYHKLFVLVCYIELWHRLFIDDDSHLLFTPQNLELPPRGSDRD